jgi:hypothetical protein
MRLADQPRVAGRLVALFPFKTLAGDSYSDLYETMIGLYPNRANRGVLWNSAKSVMA